MRKAWLVQLYSFSDPIVFENEADAEEYVAMTAEEGKEIEPLCCLFVAGNGEKVD